MRVHSLCASPFWTLVGTFVSPEYGAEQNEADISTTGIYRVDQLGVNVCLL